MTQSTTFADSLAQIPEPHLACIVFVSRPTREGESTFDADGLAEHWRLAAVQSRTRITGITVVHQTHFFQLVEGDLRVLSRVFNTIQTDARHHDVNLLLMDNIRLRSFDDWTVLSVRRTDSAPDTDRRFAAVQERLAHTRGVNPLDIFRALYVPMVDEPPLNAVDKRVWRAAFLSPSGLWSANLISYFGTQMQTRVGRIWLSGSSTVGEGSLVEYADFDDADLGHVRAVSFYNDAVTNPALMGIMENVSIIVLLLNSNEIEEGERYVEEVLHHPLVARYRPAILIVSSMASRLKEILASPVLTHSGVILRSANLRVSDSPAIWQATMRVADELGQLGSLEGTHLEALTTGTDELEQELNSSNLTATSVTAVYARRRLDDAREGRLPDAPGKPPGGDPKK